MLGDNLTPGDFVRTIKQLIDLLGHIAEAAARSGSASSELAETARQAVAALRRGIVSYTAVQ